MSNKNIKHKAIRFWPKSTNVNVASYRLRCYSIILELKKKGFNVGNMVKGDKPDIIILSKRYDAETIENAKQLKKQNKTILLLDICDNHFIYDEASSITAVKAEQLKNSILSVDVVIASTKYLANEIWRVCGSSVPITVIGDLVESPYNPGILQKVLHPGYFLDYYKLKSGLEKISSDKFIRFIWFGNHAGGYKEAGMSDLLKIKNLFESTHRKTPICLTVMSNSRQKYQDLVANWKMPTFYLRWNKLMFSKVMQLHGTSVIPISKNQFTLSKTSNRVATSLIHGLQVIADEIPSYLEYSDCIFLDDWERGIADCMAGKQMQNRHKINFKAKNSIVIEQWIKLLINIDQK